MKKFLGILAVAGVLVACDNAGSEAIVQAVRAGTARAALPLGVATTSVYGCALGIPATRPCETCSERGKR